MKRWITSMPNCTLSQRICRLKELCIFNPFILFFSRLLWPSAEAIGTNMLQITTPVAYHNARKIWTARSEETIMQQRVVSNVHFCKSTTFTTFFPSMETCSLIKKSALVSKLQYSENGKANHVSHQIWVCTSCTLHLPRYISGLRLTPILAVPPKRPVLNTCSSASTSLYRCCQQSQCQSMCCRICCFLWPLKTVEFLLVPPSCWVCYRRPATGLVDTFCASQSGFDTKIVTEDINPRKGETAATTAEKEFTLDESCEQLIRTQVTKPTSFWGSTEFGILRQLH